jgi:hypothetical protein
MVYVAGDAVKVFARDPLDPDPIPACEVADLAQAMLACPLSDNYPVDPARVRPQGFKHRQQSVNE